MAARFYTALRRLDDFLIDCLCQPMVDRLARWTTPVGIARFLMTGAALFELIAAGLEMPSWASAILLGYQVVCVALLRSFTRLSNHRGMPLNRVTHFYMRCGALLPLLAFNIGRLIEWSPFWSEHVENVGFVLYSVTFYFLACARRPPPERRARAVLQPLGASG